MTILINGRETTTLALRQIQRVDAEIDRLDLLLKVSIKQQKKLAEVKIRLLTQYYHSTEISLTIVMMKRGATSSSGNNKNVAVLLVDSCPVAWTRFFVFLIFSSLAVAAVSSSGALSKLCLIADVRSISTHHILPSACEKMVSSFSLL